MEDKEKCLKDKEDAYAKLHVLALVEDGELDLEQDSCKQVEDMLAKVLRYGNCSEAAEAIHYAIDYFHASKCLA